MDAVRKKRPAKWRINRWFLLHDNAPAHRSVEFTNFLAKKNVTTLEHLPYTPDMDPAGFYLFPSFEIGNEGAALVCCY